MLSYRFLYYICILGCFLICFLHASRFYYICHVAKYLWLFSPNILTKSGQGLGKQKRTAFKLLCNLELLHGVIL